MRKVPVTVTYRVHDPKFGSFIIAANSPQKARTLASRTVAKETGVPGIFVPWKVEEVKLAPKF